MMSSFSIPDIRFGFILYIYIPSVSDFVLFHMTVGSHLPVLPELHCEGTVHPYGPLTPSIVGVALQHQVALLFVDHSATL